MLTCVVTQFFIIVLRSDQGLRTLPDIFQNSVNQEQAAGKGLGEAQSQRYYPSPTFRLSRLTRNSSWYTGCVDAPSVFLSSPKQEEGIIVRVTVSQFTIHPRSLMFFHRLVCAMIRYRISSAGTEGGAAWRVRRDLTIRWDWPNI